MGNEQFSDHVTSKHAFGSNHSLQQIPKVHVSSTNMNCNDDDENHSIPTAESTHELTEMLTEIASEIDDQYTHFSTLKNTTNSDELDNDTINDTIPDPKGIDDNNSIDSLSFVPTQNVVDCISSIFSFRKALGVGASCRVLLVDARNTKRQYALKQMPKSKALNRSYFCTEYKILRLISDHQNIISFHSSFIDKTCYYLSTTYCSGGTMLDRIIQQGHFSESQCAEFIKNVLSGLHHMHSLGVVHRDIKCENLVFDRPGKEGTVKIIDFGNSEVIEDDDAIDTSVIGTLHYLPPELLLSKDRPARTLYLGDLWALGVVCYILVSGKVPFYGTNSKETLDRIKGGTFKWPQNVSLSVECKDFIAGLLTPNMEHRFDCGTALNHEWIAMEGKALDIDFGDLYLNQITMFSTANKLQKILIEAVFREMDESERRWLLNAVKDWNASGRLEGNEVINYILTFGAKESGCRQWNDSMFTDSVATNPSSSGSDTEKAQNRNTVDIDSLMDELDAANVFEVEPDEKWSVDEEEEDFYPLDMVTTESPISVESPTKISIAHFSAMMQSAEKEYDVDALVHRLGTTPSGQIPFKRIQEFDGVLNSKQSNKRMMDELMRSGLETQWIEEIEGQRGDQQKETEVVMRKMQNDQFVIVDEEYDEDEDEEDIEEMEWGKESELTFHE